jgi:hypothetical protein
LRLYEHEAFAALVRGAAAHFVSRFNSPQVAVHAIEKDYFQTEMLRVVEHTLGQKAVFKGGTSLSKGWGLIDRYSEDVDLFIDPLSFDPPIGGKAIRTCMRSLVDRIVRHGGLSRRQGPAFARRGIARTEYLRFESALGGNAPFAREVCLSAGIASGREPTARRAIRSYLSEYVAAKGVEIDSPDLMPFEMTLLHFRRTFVEKLFAIDHAVARATEANKPIAASARHYFDLAALAVQPEVLAMLPSAEYRAVIRDCVEIDRRFYRRAARDPDSWSFRASPALFPSARLSAVLRAEYEMQCDLLCFGGYPPWKEVLARFAVIKEHL